MWMGAKSGGLCVWIRKTERVTCRVRQVASQGRAAKIVTTILERLTESHLCVDKEKIVGESAPSSSGFPVVRNLTRVFFVYIFIAISRYR